MLDTHVGCAVRVAPHRMGSPSKQCERVGVACAVLTSNDHGPRVWLAKYVSMLRRKSLHSRVGRSISEDQYAVVLVQVREVGELLLGYLFKFGLKCFRKFNFIVTVT